MSLNIKKGQLLNKKQLAYDISKFDLDLDISQNHLNLKKLNLYIKDLVRLDADAHLRSQFEAIKTKGNLKLKWHLDSIPTLLEGPVAKGLVSFDGKVENYNFEWDQIVAVGKVNIVDGMLDSYILHNALLDIYLKESVLKVRDGNFKLPKGTISCNGTIFLTKPFNYELNAYLDLAGFHDILKTFQVDQEDVEFLFTGPLKLRGNFDPFDMDLSPGFQDISLSKFYLSTLEEDFGQLQYQFPRASLQLLANINTDRMSFNKSKLLIDDENIEVSGFLNFNDPTMDLRARTNRISLSRANYFVQIPFEGEGALQARIFGPYENIKVLGNIDADKTVIYNYPVGRLRSEVKFQNNSLKFFTVEGFWGKTNYLLDQFAFDLSTPNISFNIQNGLINQIDADFLKEFFPTLKKKGWSNFSLLANMQMNLHGDNLLDLNRYDGQVQIETKDVKLPGVTFNQGKINLAFSPHLISLEKLSMMIDKQKWIESTGEVRNLDQVLVTTDIHNVPFYLHRNYDGAIVDGKLRISNTLEDPRLDLITTFSNIRSKHFFFDAVDSEITYQKDLLTFNQIFTNENIKADGTYNFDKDTMKLLVDVKRFPFSKLLKDFDLVERNVGDVSLKIDMRGNPRKMEFWGKSHLTELRSANNEKIKLSNTAIIFQGKKWHIKPFKIQGKHFFITGEGQKSSNDDIRAEFTSSTNIKLVSDVFKVVKNAQGDLNMELDISGKMKSPQLKGKIAMRQGKMLFMDLYPSFTDIDFETTISKEHLLLNYFRANKGPGRVSVTGGVQLSETLLPQNYHFNISIKEVLNKIDMPLLNSMNITSSGDLVLEGNELPLTLRGRVQLDKVRSMEEIRLRSLFLESFKQNIVGRIERSKKLLLDVYVTADKSIRIKNSLFDGTASCNVHLLGDITDPQIFGNIIIPHGNIFLREHVFKVMSGNMVLNGDIGNSDMTIHAESRIDKFKVLVLITGHPNKMDIAFDVEPRITPEGYALTTNDIVTLISTGKIPERGIVEGLTVEKATEVEAWNLFAGVFQSEITDKITALSYGLVDKIEVTFHYSNLTKRAEPRGTLRKELTDDLKLNVSRDLRPPANEWDSNLEYRLNKNISVQGRVNNNPSLEKSRDVLEVGGDIKFRFEFNY